MSACGDGTTDSGSSAAVSYNYGNNDKKSGSYKPPMFNGDLETFSWWKSKMYSHVIGIAEEHWDIIEDDIDIPIDEEGVAINRKKHISSRKKIYKKHHKVRGIIIDALPQSEYLKLGDKSTFKAMFKSLCSNYEGNKKVREAKANLLVQQYEMFKMKEGENIETMFSRFQTLVFGLQILKKCYSTVDHVNKILRSLLAR